MQKTNVEKYKHLNNKELRVLELETRFRLLEIQTVIQKRSSEKVQAKAESTTSSDQVKTNKTIKLGLDFNGDSIYSDKTVRLRTKTRSRSAPFFGVTKAQAIGVDHRGWIKLEATKLLDNGTNKTVKSTRKGNNLEIVE